MRQVTMDDVAARAGVSQAAVSKILNNRACWVGEATRTRVLEAARELGYRPNYHARVLREGRTHCIGLLGSFRFVRANNYAFTRVSQGIGSELAATESPYSLILFGTHSKDAYEKSLQLIDKGMVDGLVWILLSSAIDEFERKQAPWMREHNVPFVVVHSLSRRKMDFHNVGMDSHAGSYAATAHLARLGHTKIGIYLSNGGSPQGQEILSGYRSAVEDSSAPWREDLVLLPTDVPKHDRPNIFRSAYFVGKTTPAKDLPTALFASEDACAYGLLKAFRERGIRVPGDIALVGFDDEVVSDYWEPELTTVYHPFQEKGAEAARMLVGLLEGRLASAEIHRKILSPRLIVRSTCGAAGRNGGGGDGARPSARRDGRRSAML